MVYWCQESGHNRQGIVRPQGEQAVKDALNLIPQWLGHRGLDRTKIEYSGNHAGWLDFKLLRPKIVNDEAQTVFDNWHHNSKWPRNWREAYHGGRWCGVWNTVSKGWINASKRGSPGHQADAGDGHYCSHSLEYARFYSRAQILFEDNCYHRVMYRIAYDTTKVNKKRWILEGDEYVVKEGSIIVLAMMIKPNYPPKKQLNIRSSPLNCQR